MQEQCTIPLDTNLYLVPIQLEDHLHLLRLMRRIYLPVYHHLWEDAGDAYLSKTYSKKNLEQELNDDLANYFFVVLGNKPIGILRIRRAAPLINLGEEPAMKLHRVYLDPSTQGQGIGKKIMQWTIDQARQSDAKVLWLEAMDTQEPALRFYESQGFVTFEHFDLLEENIKSEYCGMVRMYMRI